MNQPDKTKQTEPIHEGSCLCGQIRYTVTGALSAPTMCHCHMCQKQHGAPFGVYSGVSHTDFQWVSGAADLATYKSSKTVTRTFCKHCGSTLQFVREGRTTFGLAIGSLDTPLHSKPELQICTSSCTSWWTLSDTPAQHPDYHED